MRKISIMLILVLLASVSSAQDSQKKLREITKLAKVKVEVGDFDRYIRQCGLPEVAVTLTDVADFNIIEVVRAINCSPKPVSVVLLGNDGFTKIPDDFLFVSDYDSCFSLRNIVLPANIESVGDRAFKNCVGLESVIFQKNANSVKALGEYAFGDCRRLSTINIPDSVAIMTHAFEGCVSLKSVRIPKGAKSIRWAFKGCVSLTSACIPEGIVKMDSAFEGCASLESIAVPKLIGDAALKSATKGCASLKEIVRY